MLIDDITIRVAAGKGGKGKVSFNKIKMNLGPTGASGGQGGSVYAKGVSDLSALNRLRFKKEFHAPNGQDGKAQFNDGAAAEDLSIPVPVGTVIHNLTTSADAEVVRVGERVLICKGGRGGKGNFHFRSSINTTPTEFEEGTPGEEARVRLELKYIADVGLIGLPNAGKSSLLNEFTRAKSKVGSYPFTTLEPSLGAHYGLILADIPGLIEGASEGKGLGHKFLRHIERTHVLFHLISAESDDPAMDYETVRKELGNYNKSLLEKPEHILLTKSDAVSVEELSKKMRKLKKFNCPSLAVSIYDPESIKRVMKVLNDMAKEKEGKEAQDEK